MKKLFIILFSVLFSSIVRAQIPSNGLVAFYPFNGNSNDLSGNGNNGTVNGATLTLDRFGNLNSAYYFNGKSTISIPYSSEFDFGAGTDITISAWIKATTSYTTFRFFLAYASSDASGGTGGFQLGVNPDPMPLYCEFGSSIATTFTGNANISDEQWHYLTFVFNRTIDSNKVYANGTYLGKTGISSSYSYTPSSKPPILIGGERNLDTTHFFIGAIDDIRIYNRALSSQELFNIQYGASCTQFVSVSDTLVIDLSSTTGISVPNDNLVKIYPNPARSELNIAVSNTTTNYTINISNSLGQQVYTSQLNSALLQVGLNSFSKGLYFIQILDNNGNIITDTKKLLIE